MGHRFSFKVFSYCLCVSFLLQVGGVSAILAQEKRGNFPIGEMISRGEVKYEAREKIWQKVEPSYFPIFQGSKIKTEKGSAIISLKSDIQIEMGANTVLLFDQRDQFQLIEGQLRFRINSPEGVSIRVRQITVVNSPPRAASAGKVVSKRDSADIGTVRFHPNDAVTIQSTQGPLTVLNPQGVILASISPKESLTIPPSILENPPRERNEKMIAQVGEIPPPPEEETYWGLSKWTWGAIGLGVIGLAGIGIAAGGGGGGGGGSSPPPVCP